MVEEPICGGAPNASTPPSQMPDGVDDHLEHETGLEPAEALAVASSATAPPHVGKEMLGLISLRNFA
jgi:hypothetical protein